MIRRPRKYSGLTFLSSPTTGTGSSRFPLNEFPMPIFRMDMAWYGANRVFGSIGLLFFEPDGTSLYCKLAY